MVNYLHDVGILATSTKAQAAQLGWSDDDDENAGSSDEEGIDDDERKVRQDFERHDVLQRMLATLEGLRALASGELDVDDGIWHGGTRQIGKTIYKVSGRGDTRKGRILGVYKRLK